MEGLQGDVTTGSSAMLILKNDDDRFLLIDRISISSGTPTVAGGLLQFEIIRNPTAMTSGSGTDASILNTNFGSSKTLSSTSEAGLEGATLDGIATGPLNVVPEGLKESITNILLPKGASIGFTITPPVGNTSQAFKVIIAAHLVNGF